jgi:large subunit ribosomal protein L29
MSHATELHQMNDDELAQRLAEAREEVFNLRFQLAMGKQDNSARLGQVRRDVARLLTIQHQRRLAANAPGPDKRKVAR